MATVASDAEGARGRGDWVERKTPRIKGPKDRVVYTSTQGIHALQVSSATFYRHVRKLGMRPRRKYKSNARWWTYDDLLQLLNSVYPTVEERAEMYFRMHEGKE